jgi:hypothetical protein
MHRSGFVLLVIQRDSKLVTLEVVPLLSSPLLHRECLGEPAAALHNVLCGLYV